MHGLPPGMIVRLRSAVSVEEVRATDARRAPGYRAVPGLRQKYHLSRPTGEHGGPRVTAGRLASQRLTGEHGGPRVTAGRLASQRLTGPPA
ncbi:MAG: hypothetical protein JWM15_2741, partial [Cryptosporangiaceae bacterium]|nr:hypothetical protein [Cryptosporangiaceae bacterium]